MPISFSLATPPAGVAASSSEDQLSPMIKAIKAIGLNIAELSSKISRRQTSSLHSLSWLEKLLRSQYLKRCLPCLRRQQMRQMSSLHSVSWLEKLEAAALDRSQSRSLCRILCSL